MATIIIIAALVVTFIAVSLVRSKKDERISAENERQKALEEAKARKSAQEVAKRFYGQKNFIPSPKIHEYGTFQQGNTCFVNLGDGKSIPMIWDDEKQCWIKPFAKSSTNAQTTQAPVETKKEVKTGKNYETIIGPDGKEYLAPDWKDIAEKFVKENRQTIEACLYSNNNNNCFKITADKLPDKRSWQFIGQKLIDDDDAERYEIVDDGLIICICD